MGVQVWWIRSTGASLHELVHATLLMVVPLHVFYW